VLSLCEPLAATLLAAVMFSQLLAPSQLFGGALLIGAGIAVQIVPARLARQARDGAGSPARHLSGRRPPARQTGCGQHDFGAHQVSPCDRASA
jgi:hypothetical protein